MMMAAEEWRPVVGYEGLYEVSSWGFVASLSMRNRYATKLRRLILRPYINADGRPSVTLCRDGRCRPYLTYRLVAEAFLGPAPSPLHEVAHWDGDPSNNRVENLRWATREENEADKKRHGRHLAGERNHRAVFSAEEIVAIRAAHDDGQPIGRLAASYETSRTHISEIVRGLVWRETAGPIRDAIPRQGETNGNSRLTVSQVLRIRERAANGETGAAIARDVGVSKTLVNKIIKRVMWAHI